MNVLKRLGWQDATKFGGIYCEKTNSYIEDALWFCSTLVADYVIREKDGKYIVNYGGRTENEYDNVAEAKHWCEFTHYADKMKPYVKQDSTQRIENWFKAAKPEPTDKDRLTQIGCHFEEVSEMNEAILGVDTWEINNLANHFKYAEKLPSQCDGIELLDALCDQIVTAIGVGYMMGFDMQGALNEVIRSNDSKMVGGKFEFDDNGKIMKPSSFSEPDLTPFVNKH